MARPLTRSQAAAAAAAEAAATVPGQRTLMSRPEELQLGVAAAVEDLRDAASLCFALPPLGLRVLRTLPRFQDKLMSVALQWVASPSQRFNVIDEALLRRYARERSMTREGCAWLTVLNAAVESKLCLCMADLVLDSGTHTKWNLMDAEGVGAKVRMDFPNGLLLHYEGVDGAERLVLSEYPDGEAQHYEGEKGSERVVQRHLPDGEVQHFGGGKGVERLLRCVKSDGRVRHYEGAPFERMVREEYPDGQVQHYEGAKGVERMVRAEFPSGNVNYYEGQADAERKVRTEFPYGEVHHFEGEMDAEYLVRVEFADGQGTYD
jgi:hypothetical protein